MISLLKNLIRYARISMAGDDSGNYPIQRVSFMGLENDAYILFPYGMHANVPADKLGLLFITNGNNEAKVLIPTSGDSGRIKNLPEGEVVFFHPQTGSKVHFKTDGSIEIVSATKISVTSGVVEIGENTFRALIDERLAAFFDAHTHGGGAVPDQSMTAALASLSTADTKAS